MLEHCYLNLEQHPNPIESYSISLYSLPDKQSLKFEAIYMRVVKMWVGSAV